MDHDRMRAWLAQDPDPATRAALTGLLEAADRGDEAAAAELADAFDGRLTFGTAGLRGRMGPGPNRMNQMVVRQAAAGLGAFVLEHAADAVVVGFDARHHSEVFARESAAVFSGMGLRALLLPRALPTPVLAFAVRHLGCDAGVMVTASHNPPGDNGYKVYLGDGSQIVPPVDAQISAHIDRVAAGPLAAIALGDEWLTLGDEVLQAYLERAVMLVSPQVGPSARVAYTPMHGVGGEVFASVLRAAGFPEPIVVTEQWAPDPDFPTVAFPNPEEPGAMDLAVATAQRADADLVIAHDPDADRCAVGVPVDASQSTGDGSGRSWRVLTGDEIGSLLGWWIADRSTTLPSCRQPPRLQPPPIPPSAPVTGADAQHRAETPPISPSAPVTGADGEMGGGGVGVGVGVFAQSIVSGTMLAAIAQSSGFGYAATLTGFKWISRVPDLRFGYEEALGYCVDPEHVRDKDGITAGLLIVELVNHLLDQGRTIIDVLDDLDRRHGVHATRQISRRLASPAQIAGLMDHLRANLPDTVAAIPVERIDDLELGGDGLPPTEGIRLHLAGGSRIILRPSGTEPKVKCYLQVVEPVADTATGLQQARARAAEVLERLQSAVHTWLEPQPDQPDTAGQPIG